MYSKGREGLTLILILNLSPVGTYPHESGKCLLAAYIEGIDWAYHSKNGSTVTECLQACKKEEDCTSFEIAGAGEYCMFYFNGACSRSNRENWHPSSGTTTYFVRNVPQRISFLSTVYRPNYSSYFDISSLTQRLGLHEASNCTDVYATPRIGWPRVCEYTCEHLRSVLDENDAACVLSNSSTVTITPPIDNTIASLWDDTGTWRP